MAAAFKSPQAVFVALLLCTAGAIVLLVDTKCASENISDITKCPGVVLEDGRYDYPWVHPRIEQLFSGGKP